MIIMLLTSIFQTPKVFIKAVVSSTSDCLLLESQPNSSPIILTVPSTAFNACLASKKANLVRLIKKSKAVLAYSYFIEYFSSAIVKG